MVRASVWSAARAPLLPGYWGTKIPRAEPAQGALGWGAWAMCWNRAVARGSLKHPVDVRPIVPPVRRYAGVVAAVVMFWGMAFRRRVRSLTGSVRWRNPAADPHLFRDTRGSGRGSRETVRLRPASLATWTGFVYTAFVSFRRDAHSVAESAAILLLIAECTALERVIRSVRPLRKICPPGINDILCGIPHLQRERKRCMVERRASTVQFFPPIPSCHHKLTLLRRHGVPSIW